MSKLRRQTCKKPHWPSFYRPQRSWDEVIFSRVSVILFTGGGGIPACIAGGIPACLAAGLGGGGGIPPCLAGFQAHTQGGSLGESGREGVSRPTPKGEGEGDLARGVFRSTPRGVPGQGGLLQGGAWFWGVCSWGGVSGPRGVCPETPPDRYCCGRYASYWNAFLLTHYYSGVHGFATRYT